MSEWILTHELPVRLGAFFGVLAVFALAERLVPRRGRSVSSLWRWANNLGIVFLNSVLLRFTFPVVAAGMAGVAEARGWGLFNLVDVPYWFALVVSVMALDLAIYLQHVMFHAVPALWRLHRMHHADLDFDVTTGARFHPVEILLSMAYKIGLVLVLGPPVVAVVIFEVVLNATAMFNHSNFRLPLGLDRVLRWLVVTPDMHRVHHSIVARETNSNFGFNLPWWDRLLGTYRAQPAAGHEAMTIGLDTFRDPRALRLDRMLLQPLLGPAGAYPIGARWDAPEPPGRAQG